MLQETLTKPLHLATSKHARQGYLQSFLVITTSLILLGLAIFSYFIFYYKFVPRVEVQKIVHLQYGDTPHPYGIIPLGTDLVSRQAYDISLCLKLPRSPTNIMRGNFMVTLALLPSTNNFALSYSQRLGISEQISPLTLLGSRDILHSFRRSAIIPYTSPLISLSSRVLTLPLYLLGLRTETDILNINIGEGVTFSRGLKNVPNLGILEVQAGQDIQIYDAVILFKARFSGMRWFMHNHRIFSFVILTGAFWTSAFFFSMITWVLLNIFYASDHDSGERVTSSDTDITNKMHDQTMTDEDPDLSDTPRAFPTYGRQAPLNFPYRSDQKVESSDHLKYESDVKTEDEDDCIGAQLGGMKDSGLGTSLSESGGKATIRKRQIGRRDE